ncbi:PREDICTED: uncharacterized protein LOC104811204 [Tarenaya hassleriana]|uniref:uncharacterized protein LOC104811204 n=1 Tax=Tarenaya hassleriana TaxID=28532 RepID=UPI00053C4B09|nr:PREDICTED: uncharacterized protein LOC104811204 [Tarenaya hassleriana]
MDEHEFRSILDLFPVVRPRDYRADLDSSRQSISQPVQESEVMKWHDAWTDEDQTGFRNQETDQDKFWENLKSAAEKKVGKIEAERFCKAFQRIHNKLVYEELDRDTAKRFLNS